MSGTISGTQSSGVTLSPSLYADPITIDGEIDVASGDALVAATAWTIDVTGAIYATFGDGITLESGGSIDNSGSIRGANYALISTSGKGFQIDNLVGGTIAGNGADAIRLSGDVSTSTFLNEGIVEAGSGATGLQLGAASGTNGSGGNIAGGSIGVELGNVSQFVNEGSVSGATGIFVPYGQNYVTIVDSGQISATSGDAISFASGLIADVTDYLTLLPGAILDGVVSGGQVADLVFAGSTSATMANVGQEFLQFSTISVAAGAEWRFSGTSSIASAFENDGLLVERFGDVLTFESGVAGSGTIDLAGGFAAFANTVASDEIVDFSAVGSTMLFDQAHSFSGTVAGFAAGDTIDVTGFGMSQQVTGTVSGDVLTLNDGMAPIAITFASAPGSLVVEPIGGTDPKMYEIVVPCFRSGTRLLTPDGLLPVEMLREGDEVVTQSGAVRRIVWHGRRRVDVSRHPRPDVVRPVLIEEGAFGQDMPCRDLYLSPDHALWFESGLVEAKYLVNDMSVRQVDVPEIVYHHIELESHNIVLAEMLPVETYLDCGNRQQFSGSGRAVSLFADLGTPIRDEQRACAPLICSGPRLTEIRARSHQQLAVRGAHQISGEFRVFAGGEMLVPIDSKDDRWVFRLPEAVREIEISSTASRPAALDPASQDWRFLGIALTDVELDGRLQDMRGPRFLSGFHAPECAGAGWFRWTDGTGRIDVSTGRTLAFTLQAVSPVWHVPDRTSPLLRASVSRW